MVQNLFVAKHVPRVEYPPFLKLQHTRIQLHTQPSFLDQDTLDFTLVLADRLLFRDLDRNIIFIFALLFHALPVLVLALQVVVVAAQLDILVLGLAKVTPDSTLAVLGLVLRLVFPHQQPTECNQVLEC